MNTDEVIKRALTQLQDRDLDALAGRPRLESGFGGVRATRVHAPGFREWHPDVSSAGSDLLREGADAARRIREEGPDAPLSPHERVAVEAVIHAVGRPALLVRNGSFDPAPPGWEILEQQRSSVEALLPSVGRIDLHFKKKRHHLGTDFVVGRNVVMTNRHVVEKFALKFGRDWSFIPARSATIDYRGEHRSRKVAEFRIKRILGVHSKLDLALLETDTASRGDTDGLPSALPIAAKMRGLSDRFHVYAVGYPASDNSGDTPKRVLRDIFGNQFGVKRLQPGEFMKQRRDGIFTHDCSTLGGSSGSCVIDLRSNQVIGLHFWGTYKEENRAVALWKLRKDPLLKGRVQFVDS